MAHNGLGKSEIISEVRNLFNEPDPNNTFLDTEGIYASSDDRLVEIINLALDQIAQDAPIAERDYLLYGDDRPEPQEYEMPEDVYDIQTVEDQAGYFRYPILQFEERKFARFGFAWVVSGYGSFGPYIRGNKIGFDPRLAVGDFRRIFYWGHPGKFGTGFSAGTVSATKGSRVLTFTDNVVNVKPREVISIKTVRSTPEISGGTFPETDYDHYVVTDVLSSSQIVIGTDYKKDTEAGLTFSIGEQWRTMKRGWLSTRTSMSRRSTSLLALGVGGRIRLRI
jgi:hypothetical protein